MKQIYEPLKALAVEGDGRPTPYFSSAIPTPDDVASFTVSGAPASKRPLGRVGELDQLPAMMAIGVFPTFSSVQCFPDYAMTHRLVPLSADRSLLVCDWFVHEDAVEGVDYLLDELVGVWDATNVQDVELCERNQRGVTSRRYVPGPNSVEREPAIRGTLAFYHLMMEEPDRYEALMGHAPA